MSEFATFRQAFDEIGKGIQTANWSLITKAYAAITGETLSPPEALPTGTDTVELQPLIVELSDLTRKFQQLAVPVATADAEECEVVVASTGEKQTVLGDRQQFVTAEGDPPPAQVAANRRRAGRTTKHRRPPPKPHCHTCTACGEEFETPTAVPAGVGQCCPQCLIRGRNDSSGEAG